MAITYVGAGAWSVANNAALTPALPSGLQVGDLMVLFAGIRENGATVNTPSGWTILQATYQAPTYESALAVFYRVYQTGDSSPTVSYTGGGSNDTTHAVIYAFRGQSTTTPMVASIALQGSQDSNVQAYQYSQIENGDAAVCFALYPNDTTGTPTASAEFYDNGVIYPTTTYYSFNSSTLGSDETALVGAAVLDRSPYRSPPTNYFALYFQLNGAATGGAYFFGLVKASGAIFNYAPDGGAKFGGVAATEYVSPQLFTYAPDGGNLFGGAATCSLQWVQQPANAVDQVTITIGGVPYPANRMTIRRTSTGIAVDARLVGKLAGVAGQTMTISVDKTVGGAPVMSYLALTVLVTSADQSGDFTSIVAWQAATLSAGSFTPSKIQMSSNNMVRAEPDFRVSPGCIYNGAKITEVVTTMGSRSPWFTEVRF